jgi:uroporphyrinogen decarboxylase
MIERIHTLGGKVLYHSCGEITPFIPELIALGIDILDPIQPVSVHMAPAALKARFGDRLCFHGGMDMQQLLPFGQSEEVRAEARRYSRELGQGGGYILGPAHLFQPDVPPENIEAVYANGPE